MKDFKPTKDQLLQAMDDLEDGKPITADMRTQVNQFRVEQALANQTLALKHEQSVRRSQEKVGLMQVCTELDLMAKQLRPAWAQGLTYEQYAAERRMRKTQRRLDKRAELDTQSGQSQQPNQSSPQT